MYKDNSVDLFEEALNEAKPRIKIGDKVEGSQGLDGGKKGTVIKFKNFLRKNDTAVMKDDNGKEWDTLVSNLKKL